MKMNPDRTQRLQGVLLERKRRLWNELREELFQHNAEGLHTQFEIPQDVGEQSLLDLLADAELCVVDIRRRELEQMEVAERKLRQGTYGVCDECGEQIAEARLVVLPFASHCVECQRGRELPASGPGLTL
jgi:DnaK suppressor protein